MTHTQVKVAILGLGVMGHAFAANLLKKGFAVSAWNRTRGRGDDLLAKGLRCCEGISEAVADADVVISMLADGPITLEVVEQVLPVIESGAIFSQMGTIGLQATDVLIDLFNLQRPDVLFLDAPVSGTKAPAEQAQILILASGERLRAAAIEPVFAAISKGVNWLGPAGAGSKMKLVVNSWLVSMVQGMAESMQLADKLGFTPQDFWQILDGGPLAAPYVKNKLEMIDSGEYPPQMHLVWALKDARLALAAAGQLPMPGLRTLADVWQQAVDKGYGERDLAVIYRFLLDQPR